MQVDMEQRKAKELLQKAIRERLGFARGEAARWQVAPTSPEYRKARKVIERSDVLLAALDEIEQILQPVPTLRP